jgi:glycosyltransferase involved in cell wall biosynthesis
VSITAATTVEGALQQRLAAVAPLLLDPRAPAAGEQVGAGELLDRLVSAVAGAPTPQQVWLLCCAVGGALPTSEEVLAGLRFLRLATALEATIWMLDYALETAGAPVAHLPVHVVCGGVVVDVDHTARHDLHTGIQHVVRRLLPLWSKDHPLTPVAWSEPAQAMRTLSGAEQARALRWGQGPAEDTAGPGGGAVSPALVLPWRSVVVLPEVPFPDACDRLAALARFSGNAVVAVGYDCIPAVSSDLVPMAEAERFARYLALVKHARRVATIGVTATLEFKGFARGLLAQGLQVPEVLEVPLPLRAYHGPPRQAAPAGHPPVVVCVGTIEPRKNHLAILHAAERLWRSGLDFELEFIGGAGWGEAVPDAVARLQDEGRKVRIVKEASSQALHDAYERARFTMFPSLHEGFGLPIAESFEHGKPVITSSFGTQRGLAEAGGALVVDPEDDEALLGAMQALLEDDALVARLEEEIRSRQDHSWEAYASELWARLVAPELSRLSGSMP